MAGRSAASYCLPRLVSVDDTFVRPTGDNDQCWSWLSLGRLRAPPESAPRRNDVSTQAKWWRLPNNSHPITFAQARIHKNLVDSPIEVPNKANA